MHWKPDPGLYPPYLRTRIQRGKGVGKGIDYKSWLKIRDVPSKGTSSSVSGIIVPRPYNLLSEIETTYFYLMERKPSTVDIQEQWPILDIDRTLELCAEYGIRHNFRSSNPEPFTIDFLVTSKNNQGELSVRAASIKTPEDASNHDIRARLLIEYVWCLEREIPWTLVDTSKFNKTMLANLRFMRTWYRHRYLSNPENEALFIKNFHLSYRRNTLLEELIQHTSKILRLSRDTALDIFRYCAWSNLIDVSLQHPLALDKPIILTRISNND
jgi:hypothetical protein